jgi:hypothetical protein
LQVLARSMVSKIKKNDRVITCKIDDKQDQARDLVGLRLNQSCLILFKIKQD